MRRLAQKCKGRPACDNGAWFRNRLLKGLQPRTGACLGERAPVDLFLHRCGSALAPVDALELDRRCAYRVRAVKKGPVSCRSVLCSQTAGPDRLDCVPHVYEYMSVVQVCTMLFGGVSGARLDGHEARLMAELGRLICTVACS